MAWALGISHMGLGLRGLWGALETRVLAALKAMEALRGLKVLGSLGFRFRLLGLLERHHVIVVRNSGESNGNNMEAEIEPGLVWGL